jgi:monoamine oxidase
MTKLTRRSAIAGLVSTVSCPAIAGLQLQPDFDVLIVGAGAAGIAAARRVAASGRTFAILEASDRRGGRCFTDMSTFDQPYDQGTYSIHLPEQSSLTKLATQNRIELYLDRELQQIRIFGRRGFERDLEALYTNRIRCNSAISDAAAGKDEISCAEALPKDLGDWRRTMEFILGPNRFGADLRDLSAKEYAVSINRNPALLCRQGVGFLIGRLAIGIPIKFFSPVTLVDWGDRSVALEASGGVVTARTVIITASTAVLASGKIKFKPNLPSPYSMAFEKLKLGSYDHVAIEFNGNPFGLETNEVVFEKASDTKTAALFANVHGTRLSILRLAGKMGAELAEKGESVMNGFALDWISSVFGSNSSKIKKAVLRTHTTSWSKQPWALGAFSSAHPGAQEARKLLSEPLNDRIWFAGEAVNQTFWGTVGGAWQDGERAADAVIGRLNKK